MDDDLAVLRRWRDGDQRAGEELYGRHFDEIIVVVAVIATWR